MELQQEEISVEFEMRAKIVSEMGLNNWSVMELLEALYIMLRGFH